MNKKSFFAALEERNKVNDTPRTDNEAFGIVGMEGDTGFDGPSKKYVSVKFARTLERELSEAVVKNAALLAAAMAAARELAAACRSVNEDQLEGCGEETDPWKTNAALRQYYALFEK